MPGRRVEYLVCDLCSRKPAEHHKIIHNGAAVEIDLCDRHAAPLVEMLDRFAVASPRATGYSTSPHQCLLCPKVLTRRVHAVEHVHRMHGYSEEEAYAHIRPLQKVVQTLAGPSHRPHRCRVCKKPYVNSTTAKRHVNTTHPDRLGKKTAKDLITLIEDET